MKAKKVRTAEQALSQASVNTLAEMSVRDFVGQLRQRGITSLEDLAKSSISAAKSGIAGGIASINPEDFPVCYKFTVRPNIARASDLATVLSKVKETKFAQ